MFLVSFIWLAGMFVGIIHGQQHTCANISTPCACDATKRGLRMNCNTAFKKTYIPDGFPTSTYVINLQGNKVTKVEHKAFLGLQNLVLLRLDSNEINEIESKAFYSLSSLDDLYLSSNRIKIIPDDILDPKVILSKGIKLNNNLITTFPLNLLLRSKKMISIHSNPIQCDCSTVIPQALKSKVMGDCILPGTTIRRAISSIKPKDAKCEACHNKTCKNGYCNLVNNQPVCECFTGFSGKSCETKKTLESILVSTVAKRTTMITTAATSKSTIAIKSITSELSTVSTEKTTNSPSTMITTATSKSTIAIKSITSELSTVSTEKTTNSPSTIQENKNDENNRSPFKIWHIALIAAGGTILLLVFVLIMLLCYRKKKLGNYGKGNHSSDKKKRDFVITSNIYEEVNWPLPRVPENITLSLPVYSEPHGKNENTYEIDPKSIETDNMVPEARNENFSLGKKTSDENYDECLPASHDNHSYTPLQGHYFTNYTEICNKTSRSKADVVIDTNHECSYEHPISVFDNAAIESSSGSYEEPAGYVTFTE